MKKDWKSDISKYMHYFGLIMVFVYIGLGLFLYFYDKFNIDKNVKFVFCFFFVAYGFFRGVRWLQKNKERKMYGDSDNDTNIL
jgi:hypothetical protein